MSLVYFIRCGETGRIKIGVSAAPLARLSKMQVDSPSLLTMLGVEGGGETRERELHERFAAFRTRGEWFAPSPEILEHAATLTPLLRTRKRSLFPGASVSGAELGRLLGIVSSYVSQMRTGKLPITIDIALRLYAINGDRIGPLADATEEEIATLRKFWGRQGKVVRKRAA